MKTSAGSNLGVFSILPKDTMLTGAASQEEKEEEEEKNNNKQIK